MTVVDGAEPAFEDGAETVLWHELRNAIVGDIDHTADGLRAVAECCGAADDLHALGGKGIDRHGMIFRQGRDVVRANTVLLHAYAEAIEPANDRPTGAGREGRSGDARLLRRHIADVGHGTRLDLPLAHDRHGNKGILIDEQRSRQRRRRCHRLGGRCRRCGARCRYATRTLHRTWARDDDARKLDLSLGVVSKNAGGRQEHHHSTEPAIEQPPHSHPLGAQPML